MVRASLLGSPWFTPSPELAERGARPYTAREPVHTHHYKHVCTQPLGLTRHSTRLRMGVPDHPTPRECFQRLLLVHL